MWVAWNGMMPGAEREKLPARNAASIDDYSKARRLDAISSGLPLDRMKTR